MRGAGPLGDRPRGVRRLAAIGAVLDLAFAAALGAFLASATDSTGDAVPRPAVLFVLFATPGGLAAIGLALRRRSLVAAAAVPLLPGSLLSWAFVTLPFAVVAGLLLAGTAQMAARPESRRVRLAHGVQALVVALLVLVAGWAVLLGFPYEGCFSTAAGSVCGSGFISPMGVIVGASLLLASVLVAVLPVTRWAERGRVEARA